jgi:hypothetical protein
MEIELVCSKSILMLDIEQILREIEVIAKRIRVKQGFITKFYLRCDFFLRLFKLLRPFWEILPGFHFLKRARLQAGPSSSYSELISEVRTFR